MLMMSSDGPISAYVNAHVATSMRLSHFPMHMDSLKIGHRKQKTAGFQGMHGYWQSAILTRPLALKSTWDGASKPLTAICIPNHFGESGGPSSLEATAKCNNFTPSVLNENAGTDKCQ
ncbi:unnamed protein product [Sphagnum troendelagicum]|uniref:Uncharacterized protein n=1 Tax=Sphagnum troendelagicum TaxID=128251 RepID=A0ABP0TKQ7_9BRYO